MNSFQSVEEASSVLHHITVDNYFDYGAQPDAPLTTPWSKSALKRFADDPAEWMANIPFKLTDKMRFGSLVDDYLFWPEKFREAYDVVPGPWNKNPGRQQAAITRAAGKTPMKPEEMDRVYAIESKFHSHEGEHCSNMLRGQNQFPVKAVVQLNYTFKGEAKVIFIPIKGLLDSNFETGPKKCKIYDMKITGARNIADIWSIFTGLAYHWQDVLYSEMMRADGWDVESFHFVFAQDEPPHRVQVVECDENLRAIARTGLTKAFTYICMLAEGWSLDDFYPNVITFSEKNPWKRFSEIPSSPIEDLKVKFHGISS